MATETAELITEDQKIEEWRIRQFTHQGFSMAQMTELLLDRIDTHDTESLLAKGCDHQTAIDILRG